MNRAAIILLAFLAAFAGVAAGRVLLPPERAAGAGASVFQFVLSDLDLTDTQRRDVERHEAMFASQRAALQARMRHDNAMLAAAIAREHANGPAVRAAIDRIHRTMGDLQKGTLDHLFAVRALLTPDQARRFDEQVTKSLTSGHQ